MAQKIIRDIPDEVMAALEIKAEESGENAESYIRALLTRAAAQPTVRARYAFTARSEGGAYVTINRNRDLVQRGAKNCSQEQFDAYQRACDYVERNDVGDYEKASALLARNFDEVFAK